MYWSDVHIEFISSENGGICLQQNAQPVLPCYYCKTLRDIRTIILPSPLCTTPRSPALYGGRPSAHADNAFVLDNYPNTAAFY